MFLLGSQKSTTATNAFHQDRAHCADKDYHARYGALREAIDVLDLYMIGHERRADAKKAL